MIGNRFKIILVIWPIVLLLGVVLYFSYQRNQIDNSLLEANGLVWNVEGKQYVTAVNTREDGELLHITIKVTGPEKKEVYKKTEIIDRDMFSGGFVRAVQADQDSESEILVWHARARYYLDFSERNVIEVPFDRLPQQVKGLAENWHRYNIIAGVEMTLLLISVFGYYILYILTIGFLRLLKWRKR